MNSPVENKEYVTDTQDFPPDDLQQKLEKQRSAFNANPCPDLNGRKQRIYALKKALLANRQAFLEALDSDFGGRSKNESLLAEFMPVLGNIRYTLRHLKGWMKPSRRHVSFQLQPASAKVIYQPLGVVGIVVPFNYPLMQWH